MAVRRRVRENRRIEGENAKSKALRVQRSIFELTLGGEACEKESTWAHAAEWQADKADPLPDVPDYLKQFGYTAVSDVAWEAGSTAEVRPQISLYCHGHSEQIARCLMTEQPYSHTWYEVECSFDLRRTREEYQWSAPRRLAQLRVGLHDPLKEMMNSPGSSYSEFFGETPFCRHGGFPGTTARLQEWLNSLNGFLNGEHSFPAAVALVLSYFHAHKITHRKDGFFNRHGPASGQTTLPEGSSDTQPTDVAGLASGYPPRVVDGFEVPSPSHAWGASVYPSKGYALPKSAAAE